MYDYIVIGGGLAGTTLAYRLIKQGANVLVFDEPSRNISSNVAAGIFGPLTGKRTALTWKANEMFNELHKFYPGTENELGESFFHPMPMFKLFDTVFDQNEWLNKHQEKGFSKFIEHEIKFLDRDLVSNPFGALQIKEGGRLNIHLYLKVMQTWLISHKAVLYQHFDFSKVIVSTDIIKYESLKTQAIIFCDGSYSNANPFFSYLPHKPVHGEILEVEIPYFYTDRIINKGIYVLPTEGQIYLVGATYNWDLSEPVTTERGKTELESKLRELVKTDFKIINHFAGIRPSTKDRRPYLGKHPLYKNIFIFGGIGSKGVSLIPYLSKVFTNYLLNDVELPREADICRVLQ